MCERVAQEAALRAVQHARLAELPGFVCEGVQGEGDVRRELTQKGHHLSSYPYAEKAMIQIGWIVDGSELSALAMQEHVLARRAHERTDAASVARWQDAEALERYAAQEAQEDGLGPVVGVVGGGDESTRSEARVGGGLERTVTRLARGSLQSACAIDLHADALKGHATGAAEGSDSFALCRALGAQTVVHAHGEELELPPRLPQISQHVRERERIGAAGHGDDHAGLRRLRQVTLLAQARLHQPRQAGRVRAAHRPPSKILQNKRSGRSRSERRCSAVGYSSAQRSRTSSKC